MTNVIVASEVVAPRFGRRVAYCAHHHLLPSSRCVTADAPGAACSRSNNQGPASRKGRRALSRGQGSGVRGQGEGGRFQGLACWHLFCVQCLGWGFGWQPSTAEGIRSRCSVRASSCWVPRQRWRRRFTQCDYQDSRFSHAQPWHLACSSAQQSRCSWGWHYSQVSAQAATIGGCRRATASPAAAA